MFSLDYLIELKTAAEMATPPSSTTIRQPAAFQRAGFYPTNYTIRYDDSPKQYTLSLNNLMYYPAQ